MQFTVNNDTPFYRKYYFVCKTVVIYTTLQKKFQLPSELINKQNLIVLRVWKHLRKELINYTVIKNKVVSIKIIRLTIGTDINNQIIYLILFSHFSILSK